MDKAFEKQYHRLEDEHWWFEGRRATIVSWLRSEPKDARILDIGCSSGALLQRLEQSGYPKEKLYGIDLSMEAVFAARQRGFDQVQRMDAARTEFPPDTQFDLLIASDCLEHIQAEEQALQQWFHLLKPGGKLLLFVPAFQWLWSGHDEVNHHQRRYTQKELRAKLEAAGFEVRRTGYWNVLLFFPIALLRLARSAFRPAKKAEGVPAGDLRIPPPWLNRALKRFLSWEGRTGRSLSYPVGLSAHAWAVRPSD